MIGIRLARRAPQPRHAADGRLEQLPARPLEGLVIEARRQQRGERAGERAQIEPDARPAIDARGAQALLRARAALRARWACAARRGRHRPDALGSSRPHEQMPRGRCSLKLRPTRRTPLASSAEASVSPFEAAQAPSIEREGQRGGAIDPRAGRCSQALAVMRSARSADAAADRSWRTPPGPRESRCRAPH